MPALRTHLYLGATQFLFTTEAMHSGLTTRPSAALLLAPGAKPFRLRSAHGQTLSCTAAFIPPDVARELDAESCGGLVSLNLDPTSPAQRLLLGTFGHCTIAALKTRGHGRCIDPFAGAAAGQVRPDDLPQATERLVRALCGAGAQALPAPDARVQRVLARLRQGDAPPLPTLASDVSLSPSRLCHLIRSECGISMRTYGLWCKLRRGVTSMARGGNLTQAAAAAGFADLPHMTRTFRSMFGLSPSYIGDRRQVDLQVDAQAEQAWLGDASSLTRTGP